MLHNRGALFSLDPKSPNVIAPHKPPFNTLSAGFVMKDGNPLMTITLMGRRRAMRKLALHPPDCAHVVDLPIARSVIHERHVHGARGYGQHAYCRHREVLGNSIKFILILHLGHREVRDHIGELASVRRPLWVPFADC